MKTIIHKISRKNPDLSILKEAARILESGGIVVFPTDTVYGLAAGAFNSEAQKNIYKLKGRSFDKPLILMASSVEQLSRLVEIHEKAVKMAGKFWPGPLTLICHTTYLGKLAMGGRHNCGVRIPGDPVMLKLLDLCGFPLATTSANPSKKESAKTGRKAAEYFEGKVDLILDSGKCELSRESSVVDATHFPFVVLREGCVSKKELQKYI